MKRFFAFCTHINILSPFPVTEHLLCCFAAFLADQGLAPQTVKGYLAAVRNMQVSLGLPDPRDQSSLPMLKRVQAGIQRIRSVAGPASRTRLPITASVLERIRGQLESSCHPHKELLWAVACMAFFSFFRLGELCPATASQIQPTASIMWGDVAVDSRENPTMVRIHLKRSKCDQFGVGANIILGRTGQSLCPVTAICFCLNPAEEPILCKRKGTVIADRQVRGSNCPGTSRTLPEFQSKNLSRTETLISLLLSRKLGLAHE